MTDKLFNLSINTWLLGTHIYFCFLDEILVTPGSIDDGQSDHPLSEDPTSKWNTFFKDNQALTQIDKDVR